MTPQEAAERLRLYASVEEDWLAREEATDIANLIEQQARQLEEAREALRPFADALKGNNSHQVDSLPIVAGFHTGDIRFQLSLGDFRRARSTLKEIGNG